MVQQFFKVVMECKADECHHRFLFVLSVIFPTDL